MIKKKGRIKTCIARLHVQVRNNTAEKPVFLCALQSNPV